MKQLSCVVIYPQAGCFTDKACHMQPPSRLSANEQYPQVAASMQVDELSTKYQAVSLEEVEEGWKDVYERSLTSCMHGASCQQGPSCQVFMD